MQFGTRLRQERHRLHLSQEALAEALGISSKSISRWEQNQAIPQGHSRLQLCQFFGLRLEELFEDHEVQRHSSPLWHVPYPRNTFFTGREEILHHLHEHLHQKQTIALTQSLAINGLGGIGKTQIALEYAYQYRQDYRFVFWTSAGTQETLLADIVTIADLLQLPERSEQDQKKVIQAVKQWFATHQEWLWILDNIDDVSMAYDIVPIEYSGHLLLTSRAQALGSLAQQIEVETMGIVEGTLFLLRRAKMLTPGASLDQVSEDDLATAEAIVLEMDFLPLALDQAGAYIEEVGCSLLAYLELYRTHRKELLQHRGHVPTNHPEPVATTWSLSFQKIEQANPAAAKLLQLCAFLDPDTISEELICKGNAYLGPVLGPSAVDTFKLNKAIEELRKFSLLQRNPETRTLRIHRLVQAVLKDAMELEDQRQWAERVVRATNIVFPECVEIVTWPHCRYYLSQAQACSILIQKYALTFEEGASLLSRTAIYLQVYALYEQAKPLLQEALRMREQILDPDHPTIATSLYNLASLYKEQRNYEQAEPLFLHALRIQEHTLAPDHLEISRSLQGLADLYRAQERNTQAEPLYLHALQIWECSNEANHPHIASLLNGLALLYYRQGKYDDAEGLYLRALRILEHALDPEHIDIALPLNSLAILYHKQGKYDNVEELYLRALHIVECTLRPDHPHVARQLHNLAEHYYWQKKYDEAEVLYQRALQIWERAWGSDHLTIAYPIHGLANIYQQQGMYAQAEALYMRALYIRELGQGPWHPEVAELLLDIAAFREVQENYQEAMPLYQRVLAIQRQSLGPTHPEMATTLERYAALLQTMKLSEDMSV